jgi:lipid-A-disaccharide synthase
MTPGSAGSTSGTPRIFISAAEPSGDRHAASLIRAIRTQCPAAQFLAWPPPHASRRLPRHRGLDPPIRDARRGGPARGSGIPPRSPRPPPPANRARDLAILVDSPALHLPMAKHIKAARCPCCTTSLPIMGMGPLANRPHETPVDRLAAILPFEEPYFRQRDIDASFVGHPLVEQLTADPADPPAVQRLKDLGNRWSPAFPLATARDPRSAPRQIEVAQGIARQPPRPVSSSRRQCRGGKHDPSQAGQPAVPPAHRHRPHYGPAGRPGLGPVRIRDRHSRGSPGTACPW